jgi:Ca2+-binding RTX toxin-like protein
LAQAVHSLEDNGGFEVMKVDGQQAHFFGFFGNDEQKFKEAVVSRERDNSLFGGIFGFGKDKLTIDAGAGDDTINIKKTGPDAYEVDINGQKFTLSKAEMENLTIKGGSGNDKINIDASVDVAITVDGGSGNDIIQNRANDVTIRGGSGHDSIGSRGDGVYIDGGSGNDILGSVGDGGEIYGGTGNDIIGVRGDNNVVRGGSDSQNFWDLLFGFGQQNDQLEVDGVNNNTSTW